MHQRLNGIIYTFDSLCKSTLLLSNLRVYIGKQLPKRFAIPENISVLRRTDRNPNRLWQSVLYKLIHALWKLILFYFRPWRKAFILWYNGVMYRVYVKTLSGLLPDGAPHSLKPATLKSPFILRLWWHLIAIDIFVEWLFAWSIIGHLHCGSDQNLEWSVFWIDWSRIIGFAN